NNLPDMLIADVDYPGLTLLVNGGDASNALIVSQDTSFPAGENPVRLFSMPLAAYFDVNNDGIKDLLVSPFDPNPFVTENTQSVWLYLNSGSNNQPVFNLHSKSFLQDQMMDLGSGAYPLFYDLNSNGQKELIVGNYGKYIRSWYIG
ncbi:FG-GAP-like repeat-containing protein, partial [Arthrospira platensis SPKY1]|nr:FG-GAP-like repeat-containing protein [Arthrospira platensis SPKY1]